MYCNRSSIDTYYNNIAYTFPLHLHDKCFIWENETLFSSVTNFSHSGLSFQLITNLRDVKLVYAIRNRFLKRHLICDNKEINFEW